MLFYLASLQSISNDIYEAAAIDGASAWQTFRRITFPLLRPGHFFVATVGVIGALQLFDQSSIAGGPTAPGNALMTIVLYLYNASFVAVRTSATRRPSGSSCSSSSSGDADPAAALRQAPAW